MILINDHQSTGNKNNRLSQNYYFKLLINLGLIFAGNFMYAMAVVLFIIPNNLITGGTTGLGLFLYHTTGLSVSLFVSAFNLIMFFLGAWILGKQFAFSTLLSSIFYPLTLGIMEHLQIQGFLLEEKLVAVIYAGLLIGAGIGIVMRAGASTGGIDIPALILKKKLNFNVSATIYFCDCIILAMQVIISDFNSIIYGILLIITYTFVLNKVLLSGSSRIQIKIVSRHYQRINHLLGERIDCGTSLLHMQTGFLHEEREMVLAVISNRDVPKVMNLVLEIDPEAFIVINQINEVRGRGFTLNKVYREHQ